MAKSPAGVPEMPDRIVLFGASGHARVGLEVLALTGRPVVGIIDPALAPGERFGGVPVLGADPDLPRLVAEHGVTGGLVAIGDNHRRAEVVAAVQRLVPGFRFVTAVHPAASVSVSAQLGPGTVVMAGGRVNPGAAIGAHVIVNTGAIVEHDVQLGDFCSVGPGAILGGNVTIGTGSVVALGAKVIHGIAIGADTVIGAGATVVRALPAGVVAYGSPARVIRQRQPGDKYL